MQANVFDRYFYQESHIHHLDPRVKVLITIAFILSNALLPDGSWLAFAASWLVLLIANDISKLGLYFTFKRSFVALPFALVAVSAILSPSGEPLATWNLGLVTLVPTDYGVIRFFSILLRSWLSVQMAILLVATTQFPDMIHALEHLRVPRVLTTVIAFMYRYLFVLTDEVLRIMRARKARSAGIPGTKHGGPLLWRIKATGSMAGQLFLRSYERSDRIYNAMVSRGYSGYLRTLNPHVMHRQDWLTLIFTVFILLLIQYVGWIL
jgi:cobalt/nickel transport system permease protein